MPGRRSARQADDGDDDMQPVRMPQRNQISTKDMAAGTGTGSTTTTTTSPQMRMTAIPSMGGPQLMMEDVQDSTATTATANAGLKSDDDDGPEYDMETPPPPRVGAAIASPRLEQHQQRDAELKRQAANTPGAVRPGAVAVSGSVASNSNASGGGAVEGAATSTATAEKTGAAALLTDEEMKAAAVASSRAYAEQRNRSDDEIKADAVAARRGVSGGSASGSRPVAASGGSTSGSGGGGGLALAPPRPIDAPSGPEESKPAARATPPAAQNASDVYMASDNDYMPPVQPGTATYTSHVSYGSEGGAGGSQQKKHDNDDSALNAMEAATSSHSSAIVAELAPDENAVADRIAERVREQMEQRYGKLEEEQSKASAPVVAVKMEDADARTAVSGLPHDDNDENGGDEWVFCGFSKACVVWTTVAIVLVLIGGAIGAIFGAGLVGGGDGDEPVAVKTQPPSPPLIPATPGPTKVPPTDPPTLAPTNLPTETPESERFELLWNLIGPDVAENVTTLRNPETPQYRALEWLANQDPSSPQINDVFKASLIERYVLLVLAFQNGGAANLGSLGFLSALPVCAWFNESEGKGIFCEGPWVSAIRLRDSNLIGPIPTELGLLKNLGALDIDENFFFGTFPAGLSALSNLYLFWALNNQLTGVLPTEVGLMTSLTTFDVAQNAFVGTIPTELGAITDMFEMYFYQNQFNGTLPTEFGALNKMIALNTQLNRMTGPIPSEFGNMERMQFLNLDNNFLSGTVPTDLGRMFNIEQLFLYENQLEGTVPTEFASLLQLTRLEINYNSLTGTLDPMFCDIARTEPWDYFYSDCRDNEIVCSCCTHCCNDQGCVQRVARVL